MEFRRIEYFLTTSEHKSITKAADSLYISQQALSRCIQHLETEFGCRLFTRTSQGSALTEEGQYLYDHFKPLVQSFREGEEEAMRHLMGIPKKISFMSMPALLGLVYPDALFEFKEKHPSFELEPRESFERTIVDYVLEDPTHFGFMVKPVQWDDKRLQFLIIKTYPMRLYVHKDHPLANKETVSFAELKDSKFLMLDKGSFYQDIIRIKAKESGFTPQVAFETADVHQITSLIGTGKGVYMGVELEENLRPRNSKMLSFSDPDLLFRICFVCQNFDRLEPQNRKFIEYMKEMAAERQ